ncbi:ssDNA endodeoxyribonuclease [Massospora cicadina]|nr:ssDNA endodeoxyribonuclease [Massospora cicadina]
MSQFEDLVEDPLPAYSLAPLSPSPKTVRYAPQMEASGSPSTIEGHATINFKDSRFLFDTLKPLAVCKDKVICRIDPHGLEFIHEVTGVYQLRVNIPKRHVDDFEFFPGPMNRKEFVFAVPIGLFLKGIDFLEAASDPKSKPTPAYPPIRPEQDGARNKPEPREVFITYYEDSGNLVLNATGGAINPETALVTYVCGPVASDLFYSTDRMASIVIRAHWIRGALVAMDPTCDRVEFTLAPEYPHLTIIGLGAQWEAETQLPTTEGCETIQCPAALKGRYKLDHLRLVVTGLNAIEVVRVCINSDGFLSIQFLNPEDFTREGAEFVVRGPIFHLVPAANKLLATDPRIKPLLIRHPYHIARVSEGCTYSPPVKL